MSLVQKKDIPCGKCGEDLEIETIEPDVLVGMTYSKAEKIINKWGLKDRIKLLIEEDTVRLCELDEPKPYLLDDDVVRYGGLPLDDECYRLLKFQEVSFDERLQRFVGRELKTVLKFLRKYDMPVKIYDGDSVHNECDMYIKCGTVVIHILNNTVTRIYIS
jgi:hypothetical protein